MLSIYPLIIGVLDSLSDNKSLFSLFKLYFSAFWSVLYFFFSLIAGYMYWIVGTVINEPLAMWW